MVDTIAARGAMLRGAPEITENQIKGNTPRVDCRPLVPRGATRKFDRLQAVALAYRHVTRMVVPGQRTGRVCHTQNASGVDVSSFEIEHHDLGKITLQGINGHPNLAVLEQVGGQNLLFGLCFICKDHDLMDNVFAVGVGHFCCMHCFNGLMNAYGEARVYGDQGQRAREYEEWQRLENPTAVTSEMRRQIFARDGRACRYCGSADQLSIDHLIPQARGGSHREDNLVVSCMPCNTRKGPRTPEEAGMTLRPLDGQA